MTPYYDHAGIRLFLGDCRDALRELATESVDAIVTDPPAGIGFMGKAWDHDKGGRDAWIAWMTEIARECWRVLKPGSHALVWALPRTSHWTATAWEDAGFEPRDRIAHCFGSGFPKSLDASKAIDKAAGAKREVVGLSPWTQPAKSGHHGGLVDSHVHLFDEGGRFRPDVTAPATDAARQWQGWGTALKPAIEDWWLLRKPLVGTVAENVQRYGTGALNIDGCRIAGDEDGSRNRPPSRLGSEATYAQDEWTRNAVVQRQDTRGLGRWPANLIHDGSEEVVALFPQSEDGVAVNRHRPPEIPNQVYGKGWKHSGRDEGYGGQGSAARFFYVPKASKQDRDEGCEGLVEQPAGALKSGDGGWRDEESRGRQPRHDVRLVARNHHPTVKPTALMRYLVRLVTPPGGVVLDPFMGSGSTGKACVLEGFDFIGIEQDAEYCAIAEKRIVAALPTLPLEVA